MLLPAIARARKAAATTVAAVAAACTARAASSGSARSNAAAAAALCKGPDGDGVHEDAAGLEHGGDFGERYVQRLAEEPQAEHSADPGVPAYHGRAVREALEGDVERPELCFLSQ